MAEGGQPRLIDKKGRKSSLVWEHFGFKESDEEQHHTMCKIWYKVISAPLGYITKLFNHLKLKHKVTHDKLMKKQKDKATTSTQSQTSISASLYNATPYPLNLDRHNQIRAAIGYFLAEDMHPISKVEDKGFKNLIHTLDKRYALPSRHHFSRVVLVILDTFF